MTAWKDLESMTERERELKKENEGQRLSKVCRFEGANVIH